MKKSIEKMESKFKISFILCSIVMAFSLLSTMSVNIMAQEDVVSEEEQGEKILTVDEISSPIDVAVSPANEIYVLSKTGTVQKYSNDGTLIDTHKTNPSAGFGIDPIGNLYFANNGSEELPAVFKMSGDFSPLGGWGDLSNCCFDSTLHNWYNSPSDVSVDNTGRVFVVDKLSHHIRINSIDGDVLGVGGGNGIGDGQYSFPTSITANSPTGEVYVADTGNHRIQKFATDGTFILKWGIQGSGESQFNRPTGVAVDQNGNVYVADTGNDRIQKFNSNGKFLAEFGIQGSGESQFKNPTGVAVDQNGNVYVADTGNNKIQKIIQ